MRLFDALAQAQPSPHGVRSPSPMHVHIPPVRSRASLLCASRRQTLSTSQEKLDAAAQAAAEDPIFPRVSQRGSRYVT